MKQLPAHMFISSTDGALHDTRDENWAETPLRRMYSYGQSGIENVIALKAALRNGEHAFPGGYPMYFITSDGAALSFDSVRANFCNVIASIQSRDNDGWRVIGCDINYEDAELVCDHSGETIEAAYS